MKNRRNYYRILHVQPDAPFELIKSSYRTLMHTLKNHPDLGGEHETAVIINEAYDILTDTNKRQSYDKILFAKRNKANLSQQSHNQRSGSADRQRDNARSEPQPKPKPKPQPQQAPPISEKFDINTSPEQRKVPRVKLGSLVSFYLIEQPKVKYQGTIINFSPSGLQIQVKVPMAINGNIIIQSQQLAAKGLISYCRPIGHNVWRIGVLLLDTQYRQRQGGFFRASA
jgi:curved DNA-binding protein CbpA